MSCTIQPVDARVLEVQRFVWLNECGRLGIEAFRNSRPEGNESQVDFRSLVHAVPAGVVSLEGRLPSQTRFTTTRGGFT